MNKPLPQRFGVHSHGLIQTARGLCTDEAPHHEIDKVLARAVEQTKDVEEERARLREALRTARADERARIVSELRAEHAMTYTIAAALIERMGEGLDSNKAETLTKPRAN